MSPTQSNPNTQPTAAVGAEYSSAEKDLLTVSSVEAWRAHQNNILNDLRESDPDFMNGAYITQFNDNVDSSLDEYLAQHGVDTGSAGYGRLREIYRNASLDRIRDDHWYTSPASRGEDPNDTDSERDKVIALLDAETGTQHTETEHSAERLDTLRKAKREAFVARMKGPAYGKNKKQELDQAYKEAELAYMVALTQQNKHAIEQKRAELVAAGKTEDEISSELKAYAKTEAERIQKDEQQAQHDLFVEKSGWLGRAMEKYANLSRGQKLLAGVVLGTLTFGGGLAIGAAAGALGGLVGLGTVTGATAGLMRLWGGTRTYQLRKAELYKLPASAPEFTFEGDDSADFLHLKQRTYFETNSREQIEQGDKIKKRAVKWALGTVAIGAAGGLIGHLAADGGFEHVLGGQTQHWLEQSHEHTTTRGAIDPFDAHHGIPDKSQIQIKLPPETAPTEIPAPVPRVTTELWNGAPTERVLQKLYSGLSERDAYLDTNALYDKFGPNGVFSDTGGNPIHLSEHSPNNIWIMQRSGTVELTPQAQAYLDQLHGHSGSGVGASEAIQQATTHATPGSGATAEVASNFSTTEAVNNSSSSTALEQLINQGDASPVNVVSRAEGWYQTFNELRRAGVVDIPNGQYSSFLKQVGPELAKLHYNDGTPVAYFDRFHYEWRMYASPSGEHLPPVALRTIARFAARNNYTLAA